MIKREFHQPVTSDRCDQNKDFHGDGPWYVITTSCMKSKDTQKFESRLTCQKKKTRARKNILVVYLDFVGARMLFAETMNR